MMTKSTSEQVDTKAIVTIALLSSLGGALSTFVGYLGNIINMAVGVPFGAGQFLAGLHVFWIVLIRVLIPKTGMATAGGLLKGTVELFTGSTHGIVIVIVSLVQGIIIDATALVDAQSGINASSRIIWWLGAGLSSASNVIVFQLFYFAEALFLYIGVITILAFCSGVIFSGYFAWETLEFINETRLDNPIFQTTRASKTGKSQLGIVRRNLPAVFLILFLFLGSSYYFTNIANIFADPYSCEISGLVNNPYVYHPDNFNENQITIEAKLQGAYTSLPQSNYTGVPLHFIIAQASPTPTAKDVRITARDGYSVAFSLQGILMDNELILSVASDGLWLIAANYDGSAWVRQVVSIDVL